MIVLVMGVSGSGKTTIGERLAARLGARFLDADDFHPPQNVAKMAAGVPLTDEDRSPWLTRLNEALRGERSAVLACSALKEKYRKTLREGVADFRIVHLKGSYDFIHARLATRRHRYMPASLLASQFATLEPPADALEVDVTQDVDACVAKIAEALG